MKKKILCLALSLCVAISMFPAVAWADGSSSYEHSVKELKLTQIIMQTKHWRTMVLNLRITL